MIKIQNNPSHIFFAIRPVILVGYEIQSTKSVNKIGYVSRPYLAKKSKTRMKNKFCKTIAMQVGNEIPRNLC